jgi:hypothetical protein
LYAVAALARAKTDVEHRQTIISLMLSSIRSRGRAILAWRATDESQVCPLPSCCSGFLAAGLTRRTGEVNLQE